MDTLKNSLNDGIFSNLLHKSWYPIRLGRMARRGGTMPALSSILQGTFQSIVANSQNLFTNTDTLLCLHSQYGHTGFYFSFFVNFSCPWNIIIFPILVGFSQVEPTAISPLEQNECYWLLFCLWKNSKKKGCKMVVNVNEWNGFGEWCCHLQDCTYNGQFCLPKAIQIEWTDICYMYRQYFNILQVT